MSAGTPPSAAHADDRSPAAPTDAHAASGGAPSTPPGRFGALHYRDFRLLWIGLVLSNIGTWMQQVTQSWLLWEITHSTIGLGLYGLCRSVPFVLVSLYAGALTDRLDRRRLLIVSNGVNAVFPCVLGVLVALGRIEPWHIYLAAALAAVVDSFDLPARSALIPALVPRDQLMGALGLTSSLRRVTSLVGPSLGGLAILWIGTAGVFFVNAGSLLVVVLAAVLMRVRQRQGPAPTLGALAMVREGLGYVVNHRLLGNMMAVEAIITLCTSYVAILPVYADAILDVGPQGLGLLMSAPGLGALLGSVGLVSRGEVAQKGRLMLVSGILFGVALIFFAYSQTFLMAMLALFALGFLDTVYGAVRNTIVQMVVTDRFRGRVLSLHQLTHRGLGPSGGFVTGSLAAVVGAPAAVASLGILATVLVVWRGFAYPELREFRDSG